MSKLHPQFVIEGKLLWSNELIIRVSSLCQRYVKETLSSLARRYLAKLNTLPDTFCLSGCDGDSSYWHTGWGCLFGQARPTFYNCYTWHFLSYPSKPVKRNSSAKVVSPFKPSRIAGLRFQQSSFSLKRVFLKLFLPYCLAVTLKSRKIPNHRLKGLKERENKNFRVWQQQISTTDW